MNKMMNEAAIKLKDQEINELKELLKNVKGRACEVFTRIVGYYRKTEDWNIGKKSELKNRITYKEPDIIPVPEAIIKQDNESNDIDLSQVKKVLLFTIDNCSKCELWKSKGIYDVPVINNTEIAQNYKISAAPTAIFLDEFNNEVFRETNYDKFSYAMTFIKENE